MTERSVEWNESQVETLKAMWTNGDSATEIAMVIGNGCSRSAVLGKVHRLRLGAHSPPRKAATSRPPKPKGNSHGGLAFAIVEARKRAAAGEQVQLRDVIVPQSQPMKPVIVDKNIDPIPLLQLNDATCKWPIGDPHDPDFGFCGHAPQEGSPYCQKHYTRAHVR